MGKKIAIKSGQVQVEAELNDTKTAEAIWQALPIESHVNTWGEEIYFSIPIKMKLENGQEIVQKGDLGYWPPGSAFCVFWGQTPVSRSGEIRPASSVTVFGRVTSGTSVLKSVPSGSSIKISRMDE